MAFIHTTATCKAVTRRIIAYRTFICRVAFILLLAIVFYGCDREIKSIQPGMRPKQQPDKQSGLNLPSEQQSSGQPQQKIPANQGVSLGQSSSIKQETSMGQPITPKIMKITSSVFNHNQDIPSKYTCDGNDINPPLQISDVPVEAKSLALIMNDPDAPMGTWIHWLVWNMEAGTKEIAENSLPKGAISGINSWDRAGYGGPCPPSGTHRYFFKLYALDVKLDTVPGIRVGSLERIMAGHILAEAELIGLYLHK